MIGQYRTCYDVYIFFSFYKTFYKHAEINDAWSNLCNIVNTSGQVLKRFCSRHATASKGARAFKRKLIILTETVEQLNLARTNCCCSKSEAVDKRRHLAESH